jgi:tetrahydromethanopterin S-methyltransferase subunit G
MLTLVPDLLYFIDNFHDMEKYLENADITLNNKIEKMDEKIEAVNEEYIRASTVF